MKNLYIVCALLLSPLIYSQNVAVEPYAKDIFSQHYNLRDFTINSEESEAYFTLMSPMREFSVILRINKSNGQWKEPTITPFSGRYTDLEPMLSTNGLKLYFASNRPVHQDSTNTKDFDIWYVERINLNEDWSEPKNLGAPINTSDDEFYPSIAESGNLYFTKINEQAKTQDDIYVSYLNNEIYDNPVPLGKGVNSAKQEYNAFIAPDESYIIFGSWQRDDQIGGGDLYISFRDDNGQWLEAKNLGTPINSKGIDYCPFVNSKTSSLFFTSRRSGIKIKDGGFNSYSELINELNKYDIGFSRIYQVDIGDLLKEKRP